MDHTPITRARLMLLTLAALSVAVCLTTPLALSDGKAASPAHQRYRLGPNDVIRIQVFGEEDLTLETKVSGDGRINFPLLGEVEVAGRTVQDLQEHLTTRLADGYIRHPKIGIHVVRHRNFYVTGEVRAPGGYPFEEGVTMQKAITVAGGFTDKAERRDLKLSRIVDGKQQVLTAASDTPIGPDDTVIVSPMQKFFVAGEVRSPGRYLYEPDLTVQQAISLAGGLTDKADPAAYKLTRPAESGVETIPASADSAILPDDILTIEARTQKFFMSGEIKTPGRYPYETGMTVQKAIAMAGGLTEKADRGDLRITRLKGPRVETFAVDPGALVVAEDLIVVAQAQKFYVNGEVRKPGEYAYEKGLTVHKAITMAGGFTDKASERRTKVLRMVNGHEQAFKVKLEDVVLPDDLILVPQSIF